MYEIKLLLLLILLFVLGWVALRVLIDPVGWRAFFDRKGWWVGPMTYTESVWGRIQLRIVAGVILAAVVVAILVAITSAHW